MACKSLGDGGAGTQIFGSDCPCPVSLPYSSDYYAWHGYYVHNCGDAPFVPGISSGSGQQQPGTVTGYPRQTEVPGPPLNVPSRANQKANIFNRAFDPKKRRFIVLAIAGFLLFLAVTNYE